MTKAVTISSLFTLLTLGLVSCKKEGNPTVQSDPFIIIKETIEYSDTDFYINTSAPTFSSPNSSILIDLDGDGSNDVKFTHTQTNGNNSGYTGVTLENLTTDSTFSFSTKPPYPELNPHKYSDTLNAGLNWSGAITLPVYYIDYNGPSEYFYYWNWGNTIYQYIGFRKRVGTEYKYGWIMLDNCYGPSVMQR